MNKMWIVVGVILAVLVVAACGIGLWFTGVYNELVAQDEAVKSSWSQVENQYQRRTDLIPNLVETVKGYAAHEQAALIGVVEARAGATQTTINPQNAGEMQSFMESQGELSSALSRLMVVVEAYPDLKANQNFLALQDQLEGTENRISVARRDYNQTAQRFNTRIRRIPASLVAGVMNLEPYAYFEAQAGADQAPQVQF